MANSDFIGNVEPSLSIRVRRRELEQRCERRRGRIAEALEIGALVEGSRAQKSLAFSLRRAMEMLREVARPFGMPIEARHQVADRDPMDAAEQAFGEVADLALAVHRQMRQRERLATGERLLDVEFAPL